MIQVSDKWIPALRAPVRRERIQLTIMTTEPSIYKKFDEDIVQGSLYISQKVMSSSSFDIGGCSASELGVSFRQDRAKEINFGGASVVLYYSLCVGVDENGEEIWERHFCGRTFFVDGKKTTRKGNTVTIKAYDALTFLDIELPRNNIPYGSLYETAKWIWDYALTNNEGISIGKDFMSEEEFNKLPNTSVSADFSSEQIVSCRDAIMWIAQLTCSYVVISGGDTLVFKRFLYEGKLKNDRVITADERNSIEFSDTRTYCTYLMAYNGEKQKMYSRVLVYDESWDPQYINTGGISLPRNPLMSKMSSTEQDAVNTAIQCATTHPTRYIKMTGNVDIALEVLDVAAFTGGTIDIRNKLVAPITEIKWKYRGKGTIVCNNIDEYGEKSSTEESSARTAAPAKAVRSAISPNHTPVIPQSQKAMPYAGGYQDRIVHRDYNGNIDGIVKAESYGITYQYNWIGKTYAAAIIPSPNSLFIKAKEGFPALQVFGDVELEASDERITVYEHNNYNPVIAISRGTMINGVYNNNRPFIVVTGHDGKKYVFYPNEVIE